MQLHCVTDATMIGSTCRSSNVLFLVLAIDVRHALRATDVIIVTSSWIV